MTAQEQNLEVRLSLSRDAFHLEVDLRLPGTGITVLFGPSGSGKTILLQNMISDIYDGCFENI